MVVCSGPMMAASALLNTNAFPKTSEPEALAAVRRLAVLLRNTAAVSRDIDSAAQEFFKHLGRNWASYVNAVRTYPEREYIAYSDGLAYMASMHSVLYEFKAFLDLYARLLSRILATNGGPPGFNKGKVDGLELSGGRVVNWLRGFSAEALPHGQELAERIHAASRDWINAAVALRDTMGHFREIPGFMHMRVSVSRGPGTIALTDILPPQMPTGQPLAEYSAQLIEKLCVLVQQTIQLVPHVQTEQLVPWEQAKQHLPTQTGI